jgi:ubiquinone/menaquinone biosynthesis C-methylase UbiE
LGYVLLNPLRQLGQSPAKILAPYVRAGMTVLEPGPGMGFFTLELARRVGPAGRVVVVDIQPRMLDKLNKRAAKAGVLDRVEARLAQADSLGLADLTGTADFVLAFAMVHEMPSAPTFFHEAAQTLKPGGTLLLVEPRGHVKKHFFAAELEAANEAGLRLRERPHIGHNHAALLEKVSPA